MRTEWAVLGILLIVAGALFFLQGLNVVLGSFMSGRPEWAVIGALGVVAGVALLVAARRGKRS
jgi:hypothetical protein